MCYLIICKVLVSTSGCVCVNYNTIISAFDILCEECENYLWRFQHLGCIILLKLHSRVETKIIRNYLLCFFTYICICSFLYLEISYRGYIKFVLCLRCLTVTNACLYYCLLLRYFTQYLQLHIYFRVLECLLTNICICYLTVRIVCKYIYGCEINFYCC